MTDASKQASDGTSSSSSPSADPNPNSNPPPLTPGSSSAAAPTSRFPQPTLTRAEPQPKTSTSALPALHTHAEDLPLQAPDAASALASPAYPSDSDMDPSAGVSGHRRRKSSLRNSIDTSVQGKGQQQRRRSPRSATASDRRSSISLGIEEEPKLGGQGHRGDGMDDDMSTSEDFELDELSDDELQDDEETGLTSNARSKRKRKRRRNTLLDQRVAGDVGVTAEEKKEADKHVVKNMLINGTLIGLWYIFSLSISIYNKWMFSPDHLDFHFPLFTTCCHMLVQFTLSGLVLLALPQFRPRSDSISNPHNKHVADTDVDEHNGDSKKPLMTKMFYFTRIGPCGAATGLDIGLGNMSLKFITLTFYTMCKSSSLAFVLLFAFVFRLETPSWRLVAIIATMTAGVIMMVAGEVSFSTIGFMLVISAAFFSGFRWGLTQILLLRNPATSNPFSSIFFLAPVMFLSLFVIAVPVEGFPALFAGLGVLVDKKGAILGPLILIFPGVIAFLMTASEFALLQRTSVVTLSIAGIFKEVVTISAAGIVFGDPLTPINISGLFVTIGAICAYNWIKIKKMREEALKSVVQHHALGQDDSSNSDSDSEAGDWNTIEGTYVTMDGDIMPISTTPGSSKKKKGKGKDKGKDAEGEGHQRNESPSPGKNTEAGPVDPSRSEVLALAANKRELSD